MIKKKQGKPVPFVTFGPKNQSQDNQIQVEQKKQSSLSIQEKVDIQKFRDTFKAQPNQQQNTINLSKLRISPINAQRTTKQLCLSSFGINSMLVEIFEKEKQGFNQDHNNQNTQLNIQSNTQNALHDAKNIQNLGCCNVFYKKNWLSKQLSIKTYNNQKTVLFMESIQLPLDKLSKIKIILNQQGQQAKEGLIKMTFQNEQFTKKQTQVIFISAKRSRQGGIITEQFKLFAKIIEQKLNGGNVSTNCEWKKTPHADSEIILNSYMFGNIYKKGQIRDQWNSRYAVIRDDGLYSFRSNNDSKYSFKIQAKDVKQIWTRFDLLYDHVIFKIRHGISKTELALPSCKYSKDQCCNWLLQLYRIANKNF